MPPIFRFLTLLALLLGGVILALYIVILSQARPLSPLPITSSPNPPTATEPPPTFPPTWTPSAPPSPPTITPTRTPRPPPLTPTRRPTTVRFVPGQLPTNVNPLTGEVVSDPAVLEQRPLLVKVANTRGCAWPQSGLNQATLVFEHYVEAWGTRFTALYYGAEAKAIGPVRSARLIDLELPAIFDAMLVTSGSSAGVKQRLRDSDFKERVVASEWGTGCPYLCRVDQATVPCKDKEHTMYTDTSDLHALVKRRGLETHPQLSSWAFSSNPPHGGAAAVIDIGYINAPVVWEYNTTSGRYERSQFGRRHIDALTDTRLNTANVVVVFVNQVFSDIQESANFYSLELQFWGEGRALLFRDGRVYDGRWQRLSRPGLFQLVDNAGQPLSLKPGRTWFEFVALNSVATATAEHWNITVPVLPEFRPPQPKDEQ